MRAESYLIQFHPAGRHSETAFFRPDSIRNAGGIAYESAPNDSFELVLVVRNLAVVHMDERLSVGLEVPGGILPRQVCGIGMAVHVRDAVAAHEHIRPDACNRGRKRECRQRTALVKSCVTNGDKILRDCEIS